MNKSFKIWHQNENKIKTKYKVEKINNSGGKANFPAKSMPSYCTYCSCHLSGQAEKKPNFVGEKKYVLYENLGENYVTKK